MADISAGGESPEVWLVEGAGKCSSYSVKQNYILIYGYKVMIINDTLLMYTRLMNLFIILIV